MEFRRIAAACWLPTIVSTQNAYNLLNRTFETGLAEVCHREQVGLLAYSPLAFGHLTGKYLDNPPADARLSLFPAFGARYAKTNVRPAVEAYVAKTLRRSDRDRAADVKQKTGVFTGAYAVNPVNGAQLPVWIADYVLLGYGSGAVMAVPGHDQRDHDFARSMDLPIREVISGGRVEERAHEGGAERRPQSADEGRQSVGNRHRDGPCGQFGRV